MIPTLAATLLPEELVALRDRLLGLELAGVDVVEIYGETLFVGYGTASNGVEIGLPPESQEDDDAFVGLLYRALFAAEMGPTLTGKAGDPIVIAGEDRKRYEQGPVWYRLAKALIEGGR